MKADGVIQVLNPATGECIASVPDLCREAITLAFDDAAAALPEWRARTVEDRCAIVGRLGDLLRRDAGRLATIMTREQGKPLAEARGEVAYAAGFFDVAAHEAPPLLTRPLRTSLLPGGKELRVLAQATGATACITPWNFPIAMIARKLAPALATGCTQVIKPDERTPLCALALAALAEEAGVPAGVARTVTCEPSRFAAVAFSHPAVRFVSFTGSTEVGRLLIAHSAQRVVRLGLELGGLAPFIVLEDADVDAAVAQCAASKFRNAGQTCICANRILVHDRLHDSFVERLAARASSLRVGRGLSPGTEVGPLIDDDGMAKAERQVADALSRGARLVTGGHRVHVEGCLDRFLAPTVLADVPTTALCFREETFGPIAPVARFRLEDEAIAIANAAPYGLAAYVCTRDTSRADRLARELEAGIVGINDGTPSSPLAPFGGVKPSGWGREGGPEGLLEYCDLRMVSIGGAPPIGGAA